MIRDALCRLVDEATRIRRAVERLAATMDSPELMTVPQAAKLLRIDETAARQWMTERGLVHELALAGRDRPVRRVDRSELLRAVRRDGRPEPRPVSRRRKVEGHGLASLAKAGRKAS